MEGVSDNLPHCDNSFIAHARIHELKNVLLCNATPGI